MVGELSGTELRSLLTHVLRWLANLRRAGAARRRESIAALREVILVARSTQVYLRSRDGAPSVTAEQALSERWTELGFRLRDLRLGALAKRCDVSGRHWADPTALDADFLQRADVSLESMERLARRMLEDLGA